VSIAVLAAALMLTPQQQAGLVVVSGLPAPPGVGGVIVRPWDRHRPRPPGALVLADQEGGAARAFADAPPWRVASSFRSAAAAFAAGRETARALRERGVDVDLAPVLDRRGPLGSRHFDRPEYGVAFARGLGRAACVKHFPGLGSAAVSTDDRPHVNAKVREQDVAPFRAAIRGGVGCVMTSNAFYDGARYRASISPGTYRRLRALGFDGVAITDSLSIVRAAPVARWARQAIRAGADLLLFTSPAHARRAIRALLPLARAGELDAAVRRVLAFRSRALRARGR
jgi:beta-glucosidase-like glycosyl hydrolase